MAKDRHPREVADDLGKFWKELAETEHQIMSSDDIADAYMFGFRDALRLIIDILESNDISATISSIRDRRK